MLGDTFDNLSELLMLESSILPNIFTFIIVIILVGLAFSGQVEFKVMFILYFISMGILSILGVDSVFNLITLIQIAVEEVVDLIFMGVSYGY